jgi:ribonucleoside-triphosphate reductase
MRTNLSDYQEKYGNLFNLEATPAESTCYTLARMDRKNYPDIITAGSTGETPYYTNSSHLPVGKVGDLFYALDMEDPMQIKYTSGTVFHAFLGERLSDWKSAARLVRKIAENYKLPYFTLSPTYSVCEDHGYISGEVEKCPICGKQTEVYSRITGYYRPLKSWNSGKSQEFKDRKTFDGKGMTLSNCKVNQLNLNSIRDHAGFEESNSKINLTDDTPKDAAAEKLLLFITKTCPNCKVAKTLLAKNNVSYQMVDAEEDPDLCKKYGVMQAPTMVELKEGEPNKYVGVSNIIKFCNDIKH